MSTNTAHQSSGASMLLPTIVGRWDKAWWSITMTGWVRPCPPNAPDRSEPE